MFFLGSLRIATCFIFTHFQNRSVERSKRSVFTWHEKSEESSKNTLHCVTQETSDAFHLRESEAARTDWAVVRLYSRRPWCWLGQPEKQQFWSQWGLYGRPQMRPPTSVGNEARQVFIPSVPDLCGGIWALSGGLWVGRKWGIPVNFNAAALTEVAMCYILIEHQASDLVWRLCHSPPPWGCSKTHTTQLRLRCTCWFSVASLIPRGRLCFIRLRGADAPPQALCLSTCYSFSLSRSCSLFLQPAWKNEKEISSDESQRRLLVLKGAELNSATTWPAVCEWDSVQDKTRRFQWRQQWPCPSHRPGNLFVLCSNSWSRMCTQVWVNMWYALICEQCTQDHAHTCMFVCICHLCACMCSMSVYVCTCAHACAWSCTPCVLYVCSCVFVHMCLCVHVSTCVYMCLYMCVHVRICVVCACVCGSVVSDSRQPCGL